MDVDAFATYLAFQDLIDNFDDIDGPGNNSYLRWDAENEKFTVVAWDHNLAFGGRPGGAGGQEGAGGPGGAGDQRPGGGFGNGAPPEMPEGFTPGERPEGMPEPPEGFAPPTDGREPDGQARDGQARRGPGGGNVLATRFSEDDAFATAIAEAKKRLQADLYDSGRAAEILAARAAVLTEEAGDLIDAATVSTEADAIRAYFTGKKPDTTVTEEEATESRLT